MDNNLDAPVIIFDQQTGLVTASLKKDSAGKVVSFPTLTQGDSKVVSDTIGFNMKNGKGITKGTYTQQGEMYIYGERIKKIDAKDFYVYRGRFTTCNLDTPHFAFVAKKNEFKLKYRESFILRLKIKHIPVETRFIASLVIQRVADKCYSSFT